MYFDNAATTQVIKEVYEEMIPYLDEVYGNPGSPHKYGLKANEAVEIARERVADLLFCKPNNVIFTSSGSEANSIAITGLADYLKSIGKTHIITDLGEHESVIQSFEYMKKLGFDITYIGIDECGKADILQLERAVNDKTGLICIMYSNNELGYANDIEFISDFCRNRKIMFHCDCVQAALGYNINAQLFDSCSVSGHKIHAPKGAGALYLKDKSKYKSITFGGEQEFGLRPGTQNVSGIVGLGKAAEYIRENNEKIRECIKNLADIFYEGVSNIPNTKVVYNRQFSKVISVFVGGVDAMSLVLNLSNNNVFVSAGAACSSHDVSPSRVLIAAGRSKDEASSTIRVSFSELNTKEEVYSSIKVFERQIENLRSIGDDDSFEQDETTETEFGDKPP